MLHKLARSAAASSWIAASLVFVTPARAADLSSAPDDPATNTSGFDDEAEDSTGVTGALNPQPLPPGIWVFVRPRPFAPGVWVLIQPQPLPPG